MKRTRIKPISDKRKRLQGEYSKAKKEYFQELRQKQQEQGLKPPEHAPWCEVCIREGWTLRAANDVHHTKRRGKNLTDKETFLAVSRMAHNRIEFGEWDNGEFKFGPRWSRERGYLV